MQLWLDDIRDPKDHGKPEAIWVKTAGGGDSNSSRAVGTLYKTYRNALDITPGQTIWVYAMKIGVDGLRLARSPKMISKPRF